MAESQDVSGGSAAAPVCANGCGFFGSAATKNFCSKCYKDHLIKTAAAAAAPVAEKKVVEVADKAAAHVPEREQSTGHDPTDAAAAAAVVTIPAVADKVLLAAEQPAPPAALISAAATSSAAPAAVEAPAAAVKAASNRCASCRKKVGLLGFPCRCGGTFCALHRYAEKHACGFDFKAADREKIAKNNPLVVKAKINKI